jgi:crotonobetainyl-CoA:carnitine CoA-transferase CaiB-like acyl-CoA transferase
MTGPLSGYRILEMATNISGPMGTMLLGDQGADVIKLETASGDQGRVAGHSRIGVDNMASFYLNTNRNKRSVVIDLKSPEGLAAVQKIASQCDVIVQNFRPGVADRIGVGYDAIKALRPDIIYVSINGLGSEGAAAKRRVYDIVVQGMAGYAAVQAPQGSNQPTMINTTITDKITALNVWQAVTAALLSRERTGAGQHISISMLDVAIAFLWPDAMGAQTLIGDDVRASATPSSVQYIHPTSDGHIIVGIFAQEEWAGLCRVIARADLITDPRFPSMKERLANVAAINAILSTAFVGRTTAEWCALLEPEGAVFAPVNRPADLLTDGIVAVREIIGEYEHPDVGPYRQPAHPIRFGGTPAEMRSHAPTLGADTDRVLAEFGIPHPIK